MGLDNPIHIAFLLILLLLVFGAKRLPEMGKSLGAGMRGFKDSLSGEATAASPVAPQHGPVAALASAPTPAPAPVAVAEPVFAPAAESSTPAA
jgi:sec-independent protein translocase protein TatA